MPVQSYETDDSEDDIFHMAQRELYGNVAGSGEAYLPPTFEADGMFTHATAVPTSFITTSNHLYTGMMSKEKNILGNYSMRLTSGTASNSSGSSR